MYCVMPYKVYIQNRIITTDRNRTQSDKQNDVNVKILEYSNATKRLENIKRKPYCNEDESYFDYDEADLQEEDESLNIKRFTGNQTKNPLFQSNVATEFPTVINGSTRIPHIIHQISDNEYVPDIFLKSMRSFVELNPTWVYRFWTFASGRQLLKTHHPYLVDIYDKFGKNDVKKFDLLRIAVLYEFGGIYADLDVENLRSLNITSIKYACILPTEPFEHPSILYGMYVLMNNAVLLCRPKHPFYKQLLLTLKDANPHGDPVDTTGPGYITQMYLKYNNMTVSDFTKSSNESMSNSPYFYKGTIDEKSDDGIYIPNSQYFLDTVDPYWPNEDGELNECINTPLDSLSLLQKRGCTEYDSRKVIRKQKLFTFTIHYWFHLWLRTKQFVENMSKKQIDQIIPSAIFYNESSAKIV